MTSQVVGSDFTGAAQLPNYVNGRLLTAADLATSQATLSARDALLGQAAGHGIVTGLRVAGTANTLTVAPGLGIAPSGAPVSVGAWVTLPLTFVTSTASAAAGASFSCCTPAAGTGSAVNAGCYLLTALPASQLTGQAPLASPPDNTATAGCTAQWQEQGTQFKAIALPLGDSVLGITVTDDNRRNLLAHWCFGSQQLAGLGADLLGFASSYGGFDQLDPADLTPADLPLAVFYWNGQAIGFVDNWSARRRVTAPDAVGAPWSGVTADRRTADGQARLLQFQEQAAELVDSGAAATVTAVATFPLLPPVGFLPIGTQKVAGLINDLRSDAERVKAAQAAPAPAAGAAPGGAPRLLAADPQTVLDGLAALSRERFDAAAAATTPEPGFSPLPFFSGCAAFGSVLDWEVADLLLRQSWENAPVDTTSPVEDLSLAPLTFYLVLQNYLADLKQGGNLYLVFVKNYLWLPNTHGPVLAAFRASGRAAAGG